MAKTSKSLLNKTSTKPKNVKSSTPKKSKSDFKYKIEDVVIYIGNVIPENHGKECKIKKLKNKYNQEYYQIEFEENEILECHLDFLLTQEEYEEYLLEKENDSDDDNQNDLTEFEIELIKQGIESYKNYVQCLSPMGCDRCGYMDRCVCRKKNKYKKID